MNIYALASDPFYNSTFFSTLISGALSILLVLATILIAWRQYSFQKRSHERQLLTAREDRILGIYRAFTESFFVLSPFFSSININFFIFPEESKLNRLREHHLALTAATDEAKLLFEGDVPLVERLSEIRNQYGKLVKKMFEERIAQQPNIRQEIVKIQEKYARVTLVTKDDFVAHPSAFQELKDATKFSGVMALEGYIKGFLSDSLSDENLDDYFKPYINRIPLSEG